MSDELKGRVCVVTGASSGIGTETARGLARMGATVVMTGRNPERTAAAEASVRETTGNDDVHAVRADFGSLAGVRGLIDALKRWQRIHVLVNNAGLWHVERHVTPDGFEETFAVNHLAPFLLTLSVLPQMLHGEPARIVHISSRIHEKAGQKRSRLWAIQHGLEVIGLRKAQMAGGLDFDDLQLERTEFLGLDAYGRSKLAQILFSNELARRLAGTKVVSNAVHPGNVNTSVVRDSAALSVLIKVARPIMLTPEQGAATTMKVATDPALATVSGRYFAKERETPPSPLALDEVAAKRLWDASLQMVGLTPADLPEVVR